MANLISLLSILVFSLPSLANDKDQGMFMVVKGSVTVTSKGQNKAAKIGETVFAGDTIITGADSRAKIVMKKSKNVLNISPDSKIVINKIEENSSLGTRNVELSVEYGKLRASVEQKYDGKDNQFNVRTPSAVAGVRGTDFITSFNPATLQSQVITFHGVVAFGSPGPGGTIINPVMVQPGQTTTIENGKMPEPPRAMPQEEIGKLEKDNQAPPQEVAVKNPPPRDPANLPPEPKMVDHSDLGPELSKDIHFRGPGFVPPKVPMAQPPPTNSFINGALQNQNGNLKVNVGPK